MPRYDGREFRKAAGTIHSRPFQSLDFRKNQPYPPRPPKDWRKGVAVCIAVICDGGRSIVATCDSQLSVDCTSSDRAPLTAYRLNRNWGLMYAGEVSPIVPIVRRIREGLRTCSNKLRDVARLAQRVYKDQYQIKAANLTLRLVESILNLELLVFGYDNESKAHIFSVCDPGGELDYHDIEGFWTIGSGAWVASAILNFHEYRSNVPLHLGIFHSLAAKFVAESASAAEKDTSLIVFKPNGETISWSQPQVEMVRQIWGVDGKPHLPIKVSEIISERCRESEKLLDQSPGEMGLHQLRNQ
jgi:20S proteasome alpha/beta subunit